MRIMASCLKLYLFAFVFQLSGEVNVVFRFDDYAENSDTEKELKLIDAFRSAGVPVTFGVIPFACISNYKVPSPRESIPLQGEKANILKQAYEEGIMEVALHGFNHQTMFYSHLSEFHDVDYLKQSDMIQKGKIYIERVVRVPVRTFIPPWNSYDLNTVKVLDELGFTSLSASFGGEADTKYNVNMIPWTCGLNDVRNAVRMAKASGNERSLIVAVFHLGDIGWEQTDEGLFSIHDLPGLLGWLKAQANVNVLTFNEASAKIGNRGASWYVGQELRLKLDRYMPAFLKPKSYIYLNLEGGRYPKELIYLLLFLFCIIIVSIFVSKKLRR